MNEQVRAIANDGSFETIKPGSELLVFARSGASSLREITAADFEAGEWTWIASGNVHNQEVTKDGGLIDMQDER